MRAKLKYIVKRFLDQSVNSLFSPDWRLGIKSKLLGILIILGILFYVLIWTPPSDFPEFTTVTIERGENLRTISKKLADAHVVGSATFLQIFIVLHGGETNVKAGDYYLAEASNIWKIAGQIAKSQFGTIPIKLTIPEGLPALDIANILGERLYNFSKGGFLKQVDEENLEGYLFPDTYFFDQNASEKDVIIMMRENFVRQVNAYKSDIHKSGHTLGDILIMASILEGEAGDITSKRMVAGILWKRLGSDMLLQVDAPFKYYNGKNSYTLTKDDLTSDHEYNTYTRRGLPKTPINNPGIDAIKATIAPTHSKYWFFLSSRSGNMYYAEDFEGHKRNRALYLR